MSKSVNKVILVGNVGKDPDMRFTPNGTPVAIPAPTWIVLRD